MEVIRTLLSLLRYILRAVNRQTYMVIGVLLVSILQGLALIIPKVAYEVLGDDSVVLNGIYIPWNGFVRYFHQNGLTQIGFGLLLRIAILFVAQLIPVFFYCRLKSIKHKRLFSAAFWLFPTICLPPFSLVYLFSPFAAIGIFTDLIGGTTVIEDVVEGWLFISGAAGWFFLFWMSIFILDLFKSQTEQH